MKRYPKDTFARVLRGLTKIHHYRGREEGRGRLGKPFRNSRFNNKKITCQKAGYFLCGGGRIRRQFSKASGVSPTGENVKRGAGSHHPAYQSENKNTKRCFIFRAEAGGFEPPRAFQPNSFRNYPNKPLSHASSIPLSYYTKTKNAPLRSIF